MSKGRIYLAGPMSGLPDYNYPAFHEAESRWTNWGYTVLNPARSFQGRTDLPYGVYIKEAIQQLLLCDGIALLAGWKDSRGALMECHIALALSLRVYDAISGSPYALSTGQLGRVLLLKEGRDYESPDSGVGEKVQREDDAGPIPVS